MLPFASNRGGVEGSNLGPVRALLVDVTFKAGGME